MTRADVNGLIVVAVRKNGSAGGNLDWFVVEDEGLWRRDGA